MGVSRAIEGIIMEVLALEEMDIKGTILVVGDGWFGGAGGWSMSDGSTVWGCVGGGGAGYFAASITNGCMYSYDTTFSSNETATKTVSTSNVSETPTSGYAKQGNGYARISLVE